MTDAEATAILSWFFAGQEKRFFGRFSIGEDIMTKDEGVSLIISGVKTATSSQPQDFGGNAIPFVGALSVLEDGRGKACAVVETIQVSIVPFCEIDEKFASDYGEGDRTLRWFRENMLQYYLGVDESFTIQSYLLCERFRLALTL